MGLAAIAALVIAASPELDGGAPDAGRWTEDPVYALCEPAQPPLRLANGHWDLSPERGRRNACLMGACEDDRQRLKNGPPAFSWFTWAAAGVAAAIALAAGFYFGFEFRSLFGH